VKIFFLLTECQNLLGFGDLSRIVYELIKHLLNNNLKIEIFIPLYKGIINESSFLNNLKLETYKCIKNKIVKYWYKYIDNIVKVNFIEENYYFTNRNNIYGYVDDAYRFSFFSLCLLEYLKYFNEKVIIHLFDWHFALLPLLLKENNLNIPVVLSINNINYQGITDANIIDFLNLSRKKYFNLNEIEFFGNVNILKAGIIYSNKILLYSEVYKNSILESNYLSKGLSDVLQILKDKIECIPLGIDSSFNPKEDRLIYKKYSYNNLLNKIECKINFQKEFNLPIHTEIPIIVVPSIYMSDDEVILINSIIPYIIRMEIQIIIIGNKLSDFEKNINKLSIGINCSVLSIDFNEENLRKVFSAADIFLDLSSIGSNESLLKIALRYGVVPVLLKEYKHLNIGDNKFRIFNFTTEDLINTLKYTINKYYYFSKWNEISKNLMFLDYSWERIIDKYITLYENLHSKSNLL
jgi:starch synthase